MIRELPMGGEPAANVEVITNIGEWVQQTDMPMLFIWGRAGPAIGIENPSTYLALPEGDMDECGFLVELVRRTGASILLDINNIHVSATNHGWSPTKYLERIPADLVSEIQLAGHKVEETVSGRVLIDGHGSRVSPEVWALYAHALRLLGPHPTLLEWDTNVPELPVLLREAATADGYMTALVRREQHHG